jgi:hypothetical protein
MHFALSRLAPMFLAGAGAAAILAAPTASASQLSCIDAGSTTQCSSPGNSQITASTPPIQQQPQVIIIHRGRR